MATFQPDPDLDPKVAQAIEDAMDALRSELLGHLSPKAEAPATPSPPPGSSASERLSRLERAVEALDGAGSQTDLLAGLLQEAGAFADRAVFLVRDDGSLKGWAALGFPGSDAQVERVAIGTPTEIAVGSPVDNPAASLDICERLAAPTSGDSLMVPFMLRGKPAGALYADRTSAAELDRPSLRILCYVAAQALETLPLRHGEAMTQADDFDADEDGQEEDDTAAVVAPVAPSPEVAEKEAELDRMIDEVDLGPVTDDLSEVDVDAMIQEVERESRVEDDADIVAIRHEVAPPPFEVEDEELASDALDMEDAAVDLPAATDERETVETEVVPMPPRPAEQARVIEDAEVAPPDDLEGPGWAFSGGGSISDDGRHEEARRLARLLVTEIKLYNEEKVRQGRENHDLYEQLRDDIERSRRIYDERIDDEVRQHSDYFEEEVVRILAGGDSTALGA